jgi:Cd2+/Zn2+-exporting ATPase
VPPDVLLDRYEQEHLDLLKNLREDLHKLYNTQDEDRLWSISGRNSILSYAAQMIQAAETEVMLVLTDPDLAALRAEIEQVCGNGIKVHALLTGNDSLECGQVSGQVAHHPPLESELQELNRMLLVSVDGKEVLIASTNPDLSTNGTATATITSNRNLVLIARQFVWMELFTQRIYQQVGPDLLARLEPRDRQILAFWSVA